MVFGWRTAVLALVCVQLAALAVALCRATRNRIANRCLAALLIVAVGLTTPFALGFAGAYDLWPQLTFAPIGLSLAAGPLAYGYALALATGKAPRRFAAHLAPAALQWLYEAVAFLAPTPLKMSWYLGGHRHVVDPLLGGLTVVSLAAYSWAALAVLRRYRAGLSDRVSDEERYAARGLGRALASLLGLLAIWTGFQAWQAVFGRLGYVDQFWLHAVVAALALLLGVEGWRNAELRLPDPSPPPRATTPKDWTGLGERWRARIISEGWWREPDLTVTDVARRIGVNAHSFSRALNEGLGVNFAGLINQQRSEAVAEALRNRTGGDLLALALEMGFSSKASFNRAFKAAFGQSPSDYRRDQASKSESSGVIQDLGRGAAQPTPGEPAPSPQGDSEPSCILPAEASSPPLQASR